MADRRLRYEVRLGYSLDDGVHGVVVLPGDVTLIMSEAEIERLGDNWRDIDATVSAIVAERVATVRRLREEDEARRFGREP